MLAAPSISGDSVSKTANMSQRNLTMPIRIIEADLNVSEHQEAVLAMVDAYSRDPMGNGKPLDPDVRARLIPGLRKHPTTLVFLAFAEARPVGAAVCFLGFSTFALEATEKLHDFT